MNYELRHFDTILLKFSSTNDSSIPEIHLTWINDHTSMYYHWI